MRRRAMRLAMVMGIVVAGCFAASAQGAARQTPEPDAGHGSTAAAPQTSLPTPAASNAPNVAAQTATPVQTGGRLHGVVKSGNAPLPGVTVTAKTR